MFAKLWNDEAGFVTLEYLFGATILVLGLVAAMAGLKNSISAELFELGDAITSLSQNYSFDGINTCNSSSDGSAIVDDIPGVNTPALSVTATPGTATLADAAILCP